MSQERLRINELPKLEINITIPKVIFMIFVLITFFIVPAYFIDYYQNPNKQNYVNNETTTNIGALGTDSENTPSVAGVSTDKEYQEQNLIESMSQKFNLQTESTILILIGIILLGFSLTLIAFLLNDNSN